jgi:hypothetical protein
MSENTDKEYTVSISELEQEILEAGLIARLLAVPTDYFLYVLLNIDASCFTDFTARRVYQACVQGITVLRTEPTSNPVANNAENLNLSESDSEAIGYIRKAIEGGFPCGPYVARCLLELHDRALLRRIAENTDFDEAWQKISLEYAEDTDDVEW